MSDDTEPARRELLPLMTDQLAAARAHGEPVWDVHALRARFEVLGYMAPFVVVIRRSDGAKGSLMFTHHPRLYFGWEPEQEES